MGETPFRLNATDLASFVRLQFCPRYLGFRSGKGDKKVERLLRDHPLNADPTYQEKGLLAEKALAGELESQGFRHVEAPDWDAWRQHLSLASPGERLYARQVAVEARHGGFLLMGRLDFVLLDWRGEGPAVRVVEAKATRKDRTHHHIQLALYALILGSSPPTRGGKEVPLEFILVRMDPGTGQLESPLRPLSQGDTELLEQALADVRALLAPGGPVEAILQAEDPLGLPYLLNARCDACPYSPVCLLTGQEGLHLELLGLKGDALAALREAGLGNLRALAEAKPQALAQALAGMETPLPPEHLQKKAQARLAGLVSQEERQQRGWYPLLRLENTGFGRLPPHRIGEAPLVRVYLVVEPDLLEERINALVAHVALGEEELPPEALEALEVGEDGMVAIGAQAPDRRGWMVAEVREGPWTGDPRRDDEEEGKTLVRFFSRLVDVLQSAGRAVSAQHLPVHFYVWSSSEVRLLVEAALRAGPVAGEFLKALWHLMGCRESLEQLIFSPLQEEVETRFALGYTSRSLLATTVLPWPKKDKGSRPFPWVLNGQRLRQLFQPWLFDFVKPVDGAYREVYSRNYDALPPVYWRAFWERLPQDSFQGRGLLEKVKEAAPHVPLYLQARALALRWLEERITPKNRSLAKPPLDLQSLPHFRLKGEGVSRVALDFLRFEQHVRLGLWLADKTLPPGLRVLNGTALLLEEPRIEKVERELQVRARIRPYPNTASLKDLEARVGFAQGDFVRVSPVEDPDRPLPLGQALRQGFTALLREVDWEKGEVDLVLVPNPDGEDRYVLPSHAITRPLMVMDPSPSDYVARRVDERLSRLGPGEALRLDRWFHPEHPELPPLTPDPGLRVKAREILEALRLPGGHSLQEGQIQAILDSLSSRIHLLQGPPGTGKTQVTAVALHLWAQLLLPEGGVLAVAAATHTAVDTLMGRVQELEGAVQDAFQTRGLPWKSLPMVRLDPPGEERERRIPSSGVFFGTTNAVLKALMPKKGQEPELHGLDLLIVDEASMMLFPHFLALAASLRGEGWRTLLAGDHRQLAPVIQHQWTEEDRPGVQRYLPYLSAFEGLLRLRDRMADPDNRIRRSALTLTHRLPAEVRSLIQPLYRRDGILLKGRPPASGAGAPSSLEEAIWTLGEGVYLLLHNEDQSRKRNPFEAELIRRVLAGNPSLAPEEVAVVTPFRAQRTLLRESLGERVGTVDTVERLQGGEREVVFYSASASDPNALADLQDFLLDVNRTNVAFSRAKKWLIVLASENLLRYVPREREAYEDAVLWKEVRRLCDHTLFVEEVSWEGRLHRVSLRVPRQKIGSWAHTGQGGSCEAG